MKALTGKQQEVLNDIVKGKTLVTCPYDKAACKKLAALGLITLTDERVRCNYKNDDGTWHHVWHVRATVVQQYEPDPIQDGTIELDLHVSYKDMVLDELKRNGFKRVKYGDELTRKCYSISSKQDGRSSKHFWRVKFAMLKKDWMFIKLSLDGIDYNRNSVH